MNTTNLKKSIQQLKQKINHYSIKKYRNLNDNTIRPSVIFRLGLLSQNKTYQISNNTFKNQLDLKYALLIKMGLIDATSDKNHSEQVTLKLSPLGQKLINHFQTRIQRTTQVCSWLDVISLGCFILSALFIILEILLGYMTFIFTLAIICLILSIVGLILNHFTSLVTKNMLIKFLKQSGMSDKKLTYEKTLINGLIN